jgi:hypothetical protein
MKTLPKSFLVDGTICPSYSRFVTGNKQPATKNGKNYASCQEGAWKDVKRGFGVSKNTWHFLYRPILLHDLKASPTELFLVCSSTKSLSHTVMQAVSASYNYRERYDPSKGALDTLKEVEQPAEDIQLVQAAPSGETRSVVRISNALPQLQAAMTRSERFAELTDLAVNRRLHKALMDKFNVE